MRIRPIATRRIDMSLRISHLAPLGAVLLIFGLAMPAFGEAGGSAAEASSFGAFAYRALDPIELGKEAKPLYQVDAYFRLKETREIAARERGTFIVPSETGREPNVLSRVAKPLYDVASYFRIKEVREIAARRKAAFTVPSETGQEPTELGRDRKPVIQVDAYLRLKDLQEIGSQENKGVLIPSKVRA
jgi:hypothetical protein